MKKLGVNIDHIATLRNARGEAHPSPLKAAKLAMKYGADSITIHLREDRRHIKDLDFKKIKNIKRIPINLELAANYKMLKIALKNKPNFVCIVPGLEDTVVGYGTIPVLGKSINVAHYTATNQIYMYLYDGNFAGTTNKTIGTVTYWAAS